MDLNRKYRPKEFADMVGNKPIIDSVQSLAASDNPPHAWLFAGPSGIGKTTIAEILARTLGAGQFGMHSINAADFRGIDDIRELVKLAAHKSAGSPVHAFILDEAHQLTTAAQNVLLTHAAKPVRSLSL